MQTPSFPSYSDPPALSDQQYAMVFQSSVHPDPPSSDELSGYAISRAAMPSSYPPEEVRIDVGSDIPDWSQQESPSSRLISTSS
jgi:hypothetical protein